MYITSRPLSTGSAFLSMFFLGVGVAIVGATARMVGLAPSQIGYLVAAQNVGFGIAVIVAGTMSDIYRKPVILTVGLAMLGLSFFLLYRSEVFAANLAIPVGGIVIPGLVGLLSDAVSFTVALFVFPASALLVLISAVASDRVGAPQPDSR
jgi:hypothetical protein